MSLHTHIQSCTNMHMAYTNMYIDLHTHVYRLACINGLSHTRLAHTQACRYTHRLTYVHIHKIFTHMTELIHTNTNTHRLEHAFRLANIFTGACKHMYKACTCTRCTWFACITSTHRFMDLYLHTQAHTHLYELVYAHRLVHRSIKLSSTPACTCCTYKFSHTYRGIVSIDSGTVKCIHLHMHRGLHRHMSLYKHISTHTHTQGFAHIDLYVHIGLYGHMGLHKCTGTHRCMGLAQIQTLICTYTHMLAYTC